jgi:hypothetical protein
MSLLSMCARCTAAGQVWRRCVCDSATGSTPSGQCRLKMGFSPNPNKTKNRFTIAVISGTNSGTGEGEGGYCSVGPSTLYSSLACMLAPMVHTTQRQVMFPVASPLLLNSGSNFLLIRKQACAKQLDN